VDGLPVGRPTALTGEEGLEGVCARGLVGRAGPLAAFRRRTQFASRMAAMGRALVVHRKCSWTWSQKGKNVALPEPPLGEDRLDVEVVRGPQNRGSNSAASSAAVRRRASSRQAVFRRHRWRARAPPRQARMFLAARSRASRREAVGYWRCLKSHHGKAARVIPSRSRQDLVGDDLRRPADSGEAGASGTAQGARATGSRRGGLALPRTRWLAAWLRVFSTIARRWGKAGKTEQDLESRAAKQEPRGSKRTGSRARNQVWSLVMSLSGLAGNGLATSPCR